MRRSGPYGFPQHSACIRHPGGAKPTPTHPCNAAPPSPRDSRRLPCVLLQHPTLSCPSSSPPPPHSPNTPVKYNYRLVVHMFRVLIAVDRVGTHCTKWYYAPRPPGLSPASQHATPGTLSPAIVFLHFVPPSCVRRAHPARLKALIDAAPHWLPLYTLLS